MRTLAGLLSIVFLVTVAQAEPRPEPEAWLAQLTDDVIVDLAAGRPLVVRVHVPLCDNRVLRCGNRRLGDGDVPRWNLYWGTSEGFLGWFDRAGSGWTRAPEPAPAGRDPDILDVRVWRRHVVASPAWRTRGAPARFDVEVVAHAWRGTAIDRALAAYLDEVHGGGASEARIVAWVGHNRLMDVEQPDWAALAASASARRRGVIAIACHTGAYLADVMPAAARVPLLFTRDFLMASAPTLEGAVMAFARGEGYAGVRSGAARGYATGQGKPVNRVTHAFTNPADPRWTRSR